MSEKNTNLVPEDGHKNLAEKTDQLLAEAEKSGLELKELQMSIENWDNRQLKTGTVKVKFCPPQRSTL